MTPLTQPLRDEHEELLPHLEHVLSLADDIEVGTSPRLVERVGRTLHFLKEEEIYLPLLDERLTAEEGRALIEALGHAG